METEPNLTAEQQKLANQSKLQVLAQKIDDWNEVERERGLLGSEREIRTKLVREHDQLESTILFQKRQDELLEQVPEEFRSTLSYMAYEEGHSGGYGEVNNVLSGLIAELKEPIKKFEARIRFEAKQDYTGC